MLIWFMHVAYMVAIWHVAAAFMLAALWFITFSLAQKKQKNNKKSHYNIFL